MNDGVESERGASACVARVRTRTSCLSILLFFSFTNGAGDPGCDLSMTGGTQIGFDEGWRSGCTDSGALIFVVIITRWIK